MNPPSYFAKSIRLLELAGESWNRELVSGAQEACLHDYLCQMSEQEFTRSSSGQ
jgi:hypothetical protein